MKTLQSIGTIISTIVGMFIVVIVAMILLVLVERMLGFYPGEPGWYVAKIAAEKEDVHICKRIVDVPWNLVIGLGPAAKTMRADCIYEYASIKHDPSVCALIMPSTYGIRCVGQAEDHLPCDVRTVANTVYWKEGNSEHTLSLEECSKADTARSDMGNQCCHVAKVTFMKDVNDCSPVKGNTPVYDHCLYELAWKQREPNYCEGITNTNVQGACTVQTNAIKQDPSICPDCFNPSI